MKLKNIVNWFVFTFGLVTAILFLIDIRLMSEDLIKLFMWFYYGYFVSFTLNYNDSVDNVK